MSSIYTRNQPVATDLFEISQPFLYNNTNAADTSFGNNHYPFSDTSGNTGKHNVIQTPAYITNPATYLPPVTATNEPALYAYVPLNGSGSPTTNLPVMQYSRGGSSAVPSPVTTLQSPSSPQTINASGGTLNILDFTGINIAIANLYAFNSTSPSAIVCQAFVGWNGSAFYINAIVGNPTAALGATSSGNVLQLRNGSASSYTNIYWTLSFLRIQ